MSEDERGSGWKLFKPTYKREGDDDVITFWVQLISGEYKMGLRMHRGLTRVSGEACNSYLVRTKRQQQQAEVIIADEVEADAEVESELLYTPNSN